VVRGPPYDKEDEEVGKRETRDGFFLLAGGGKRIKEDYYPPRVLKKGIGLLEDVFPLICSLSSRRLTKKTIKSIFY